MLSVTINGKEMFFDGYEECADALLSPEAKAAFSQYTKDCAFYNSKEDCHGFFAERGIECKERLVLGIFRGEVQICGNVGYLEWSIKDQLIAEKYGFKSPFDISDEELLSDEPQEEVDLADKYPDIPVLKLHGQEFFDAVGATYRIIPGDYTREELRKWREELA